MADALTRLREAKGLSRDEFAFQADIHRTYVSGIERGKRNPTVIVLERRAKSLSGTAGGCKPEA